MLVFLVFPKELIFDPESEDEDENEDEEDAMEPTLIIPAFKEATEREKRD